MAIIRPGRASTRPGSVGRSVVFRSQGGRLYAQAWPRPRGTPKQLYQRANLERMKIAQRAAHHRHPLEATTLQEALAAYLDSHEGVRGAAAIRARDWWHMIITGRAWAFDVPGFGRLWTSAVIRDASDVLDWMIPRVGSMLVRTDTAWLPTVQCEPGRVLCMTGPDPWPGACPKASLADADTAVGGH